VFSRFLGISQPSILSSSSNPTQYDDPPPSNLLLYHPKRQHMSCPSTLLRSLSSISHISATIYKNLISSTRTNLWHNAHSTILGFIFGIISIPLLSSSPPTITTSSKSRLLCLASGESSLSAHKTIIIHAPILRRPPIPHNPFSLNHLSIFRACAACRVVVPLPSILEIIMCHGFAQCTCLPSTLTIVCFDHLLSLVPISFACGLLILPHPLLSRNLPHPWL